MLMTTNFRRRLMMLQSQEAEEQFTIVDYIEANGTSFIELDYKPNVNTEIYISYEGTVDKNPILDASKSLTTSRIYIECEDGYINYAIGNVSQTSQIERANGKDTLTLSLPPRNVALMISSGAIATSVSSDMLYLHNSSYSTQLTQCVNVNLFRDLSNNNIASGIKLYGMAIYEDGQHVMDLLPFDTGRRNGLIDTLSGKLYTDPNGVRFKSPMNP